MAHDAAGRTTRHERRSIESATIAWGALATIAFALVLALAGLAVCSLPTTTLALSSLFSDDETSPYTAEQLTRAALATRDYTVGSHDRSALNAVIDPMEAALAEEAGLTLDEVRSGKAASSMVAATTLAKPGTPSFGDTTRLPEDALSHLDDVYAVIQPAFAAFGIASAAAAGCALVLSGRSRRALGGALVLAGSLTLALFALVGAWAALDFDGMFAAFHSLFFAAGTWTFYADSLLICMYPIAFWMGMGIVWLVATALGCTLCLIIGRSLTSTSRARKARVS